MYLLNPKDPALGQMFDFGTRIRHQLLAPTDVLPNLARNSAVGMNKHHIQNSWKLSQQLCILVQIHQTKPYRYVTNNPGWKVDEGEKKTRAKIITKEQMQLGEIPVLRLEGGAATGVRALNTDRVLRLPEHMVLNFWRESMKGLFLLGMVPSSLRTQVAHGYPNRPFPCCF